jgi:hypothetical protein
MANALPHARLSSMSRPTRPATDADIEALPPNVVGEILGGILHTHPRPALPHAHAASVATHCGDATARIEPFDAIELELAALWAR